MTNSWMVIQTLWLLKPLAVRLRVHARELVLVVMGSALLLAFSFPHAVLADVPSFGEREADKKAIAIYIEYMQNFSRDPGTLPEAGVRTPSRTMVVPATAYTSDPWETDSTPFTTASGTQVRHGVLAANFLPIGTRVRIPEVYGDEIFIVEDRMNARYHKRVDIWMEEKAEARAFGVQRVTLEVF